MGGIEGRLKELIEEILANYPELFLVEVEVKGNVGNQKVIVRIDGEPSLTIDQCVAINRALGEAMDDAGLIDSRYSLEVTSPGIDLPLRHTRQYSKNIGRQVKVLLKDGSALEGKLEESHEDMIVVEGKDSRHELDIKDIEKTCVLVSFN